MHKPSVLFCGRLTSVRRVFSQKSLILFFATAFCIAIGADLLAEPPNDPPSEFAGHWIAKFNSDYPTAAKKLSEATSSIHCSGKYLAPYLPPNKGRSPNEAVWIHFDVLEHGPMLRWRRKELNSGARDWIRVLTPDDTFEVVPIPNDSEHAFKLNNIGYDSAKDAKAVSGILARRFVHATTQLWDLRDVADSFQAGDLSLENAVPHQSNKDWVTYFVRFTYPSSSPNYGQKGRGTITFSPEQSWSIREWEYELPFKAPITMKMKVDVQDVTGLGIVPRTCVFTSSIKRQSADWKELEHYKCDFDAFEGYDYAASDFRLAAFGLRDPRPRSWSIVTINVMVVMLIAGVVAARWALSRYRRR
jgi:hypothetical protein